MLDLVPSTDSLWLEDALKVSLRVVKKGKNKELEIRWPTVEEMRLSADLLQSSVLNGYLLGDVYGSVDGGRMPCAHYVNADLQNAYFKGFT